MCSYVAGLHEVYITLIFKSRSYITYIKNVLMANNVHSIMASQFSQDGKYFAKLTVDSKLKIWQTATGTFEQEFTPDFHLTSPCTCLHFVLPVSLENQQRPPRKKKRDSLDSSTIYVALGTTSGILLVYSVTKAELDFTINSETNQSISCVSWNSGNILFSAIDCNIISWNLDKKTIRSKWKGGNEKITAIMALPENKQILTASRNIKLWDVAKKENLTTFTGHSFEISILNYIKVRDDGIYVLSGSKGDRLISVWNIEEGDFSVKNAVANFLLEDIPVNIALYTFDGVSSVAVLTRSGVVHFFQHTLNGKCSKPIKPKKTLQVASDSSQQSSTAVAQIPILGVYLNTDLTLTIGHGNEVVLSFENVTLNEYEKVHCLIRKDPRILVESVQKKTSKVRTPVIDNHVHYVTPHTITSSSKRKSHGTNEVPMEQRLENLTLNKLDNKSTVPKSNNVAQLLVQGLHSKDKSILKSVLNKHDETIIKNTVKRLPMPVIVPFIQEITAMIQGKTVLSQNGSLWLKHLLLIHTGLLLANPEITDLLGPVLGSVESRLSLLTPLNRLKGRLDLLVSQVAVASVKGDEDHEALLLYDDKDFAESDNEDVDIAPQSESDNEWIEESSGADENNEEVSDDDIEML